MCSLANRITWPGCIYSSGVIWDPLILTYATNEAAPMSCVFVYLHVFPLCQVCVSFTALDKGFTHFNIAYSLRKSLCYFFLCGLMPYVCLATAACVGVLVAIAIVFWLMNYAVRSEATMGCCQAVCPCLTLQPQQPGLCRSRIGSDPNECILPMVNKKFDIYVFASCPRWALNYIHSGLS